MVRPLDGKWFMTDAELKKEKRRAHEKVSVEVMRGDGTSESSSRTLLLVLAWMAVLIPMNYGVYQTILSATKLFGHFLVS